MPQKVSTTWIPAMVLASLGLGGCGTSSPADTATQSGAPGQGSTGAPQAPMSARWVDDRLAVDVPVPVITVGLPETTVAGLRAALQPHTVDHGNGDINQSLPPDLEEAQDKDVLVLMPLSGEFFSHPVLPTARFDVREAPASLQDEFRAALERARVGDGRFDAIAIEDWLADRLGRKGLAPNPNAPTIVLLHLAAFGEGPHAWKLQGRTGWLEPVRVFGERHPMIVIDPSAERDPWVSTESSYLEPVPNDAVEAMAEFVRDAVEYRVLPASVYPVAQASCHAVTAIVGVRPTSVAEATSLMRTVRDALNPEWIEEAFDHLTGGNAVLDLKVLQLPVDDPALDAIARGEFANFETLRAWLTLNWEQYHVDHPGCEEYLAVVFAGDVASVPGGGVLGIGTYDDSPGKRIAMGWVHDIFRLTFDPESPLCRFGCGGKDYLNWWNYLLIHEGGHIFGQHHTFHKVNIDGSLGTNESFSSVWSSMSYQDDGRCADLGALDHASWMRNRAGFALRLAAREGREGSPAWNAAMGAAAALDWQGVWRELQGP